MKLLTFRGRPSGCTKVRKIFSVTVKRFSVISLSGWNSEKEKTESVNENENKEKKSVDEFQYILQQKPANAK